MLVGVMLVFAVIGVANERKDHDYDDGRDDANDNHNDDN